MSEGLDKETLEGRLKAMLDTLDESDLRYQALKGSVEFRSVWVDLAEFLSEIVDNDAFKEWGYRTVFAYCATELDISRATARKLLEGYSWLAEEAPEYLPKNRQPDQPARVMPDIDTVSVMAKGYREVADERVPQETYMELKDSALRGERNARELRKEFKEAVPEHLRETPAPNPLKHLKRALNEVEKALDQMEPEEQAELLQQAGELRDAIFALVSSQEIAEE
ncbi:hypothetical protein DV096_12905 [Bradymonadaceae bacterium TMQ3]|uniref:DUF3102 domain-containing protein n=1 Tax=Lujinxingia sediminis TaxID=2480984 RepID=A0ABY0CUF6_9DELT|nr:hypothetical protein [Lujinxingia sediminis]RDV37406.1 hypothetical protein DV096_12905 [Bradymonadaceae bacterium TMQ3]RVU45897.1 hypothetical protein EA187_09065 [Lujinxingia sediminis]TXC74966.1 hypothetical protein FRC91_12780 [Bradymonadales bacterium TMQ1]